MVLALLIVAAVADLALAGLLIAVSGFIIGAGPESMHGGSAMMAAWIAMVIFCIAAPVGGFVLRAYRRPATGLALAWLPLFGALVAVSLPPRY